MKPFVACFVLVCAFAYALSPAQAHQTQTAGNRPQFDAVSIKPSAPGATGGGRTVLPGGKARFRNQSLKAMLSVAFTVSEFQIFGDSHVIETRYDMDASAGGPFDTPQLRLMLGTALEDQLKLKYHHETRDLPIYTLSLAKLGVMGPGLVEDANGDCAAATSVQAPTAANRSMGIPTNGGCGNLNLGRNTASASIRGYRGRIVQLADRLSTALGRPVIDKTGLTGVYNVVLTWTPDPTVEAPANPLIDPSGPSLFTAIQEQLGLKLESGKGPVDVIVVDHAEKPGGN